MVQLLWSVFRVGVVGVMMLAGIGRVNAMVPMHLVATRDAAQSFDGQYVAPPPSASDSKASWWWMNAQADSGVDGNPPANIQVIFYQGYVFPRPSADAPEFYVDVNGLFANGSAFSVTLVADSGAVSSEGSQAVGTWAGAGSFMSSPGESYQVALSNGDLPGSILIQAAAAPMHYACNTTTSPLFSAFAPPSISAEEQVLFDHLGWAVSLPGGRATVSLMVDGSPLTFTGTGYHDQNFIDSNDLFANVISQWFFGTAQVGPYVFSYLEATSFNSNTTLTTGFLARDGVILQNQCSFAPTAASSAIQAPNTSRLTPFGVIHSQASGVDVPQGYVVDYVLADGEQFSFTLTEEAEIVDLNVYHRSIGNVTGGKVGEAAAEAVILFEWLNPGVNVYVPS